MLFYPSYRWHSEILYQLLTRDCFVSFQVNWETARTKIHPMLSGEGTSLMLNLVLTGEVDLIVLADYNSFSST